MEKEKKYGLGNTVRNLFKWLMIGIGSVVGYQLIKEYVSESDASDIERKSEDAHEPLPYHLEPLDTPNHRTSERSTTRPR